MEGKYVTAIIFAVLLTCVVLVDMGVRYSVKILPQKFRVLESCLQIKPTDECTRLYKTLIAP